MKAEYETALRGLFASNGIEFDETEAVTVRAIVIESEFAEDGTLALYPFQRWRAVVGNDWEVRMKNGESRSFRVMAE